MWGLAVLPPTACALNAAQQQMGALPLPVQPQLTAPGASQGAGSYGDCYLPMPPQAPERRPGAEQLGQSSAVVQEQAQVSAAAAAAATAAPSLPSAKPTADGAADAAAAEVIDLTLDDDDDDDDDDGDDDEPADSAAGPAAVPAAAATMARQVRALDAELRADVPPEALPQAGDAVQPPSGLQASPAPEQPGAAQRCYYSSIATSHGPLAVQRGSTAVLTAREGHDLFVPSSLADASGIDAPAWLPLTLLLERAGAVNVIPAILRGDVAHQPQGPVRQYCIPAKGVSELLQLSGKRDSLGRLHIRFTARCILCCVSFDYFDLASPSHRRRPVREYISCAVLSESLQICCDTRPATGFLQLLRPAQLIKLHMQLCQMGTGCSKIQARRRASHVQLT